MADDRDDAPVHGIPRPPAGELVLRRRLRVLRDILEDPDSPYRSRLIDLTDLLIESDEATPADLSEHFGPGCWSKVNRPIDLLGSPPPRQGGRR